MAATHLESLNIDKKLDKVSKGFVLSTDHRDESAKQSQEIGSRCINSPEGNERSSWKWLGSSQH